jgi:hypothetical protein
VLINSDRSLRSLTDKKIKNKKKGKPDSMDADEIDKILSHPPKKKSKCCLCCRKKKEQTQEEKSARARQLWNKVRMSYKIKGFAPKLDPGIDSSDFGLDEEVSRSIDSFEARKIRDIKVTDKSIKRKMKGLAWYLIDKNSTFAIIQNIQIQVMTWSTMIITPLCICFPAVKDRLLYFEWFVDCSWTLEIVLNFLVA